MYSVSNSSSCTSVFLFSSHNISVICYSLQKRLWSCDSHGSLYIGHSNVHSILNICYNTPWIAQQGRMTMQYYIYHALIIPPMSAPIIPPLILIADKMNIPMTSYTAVAIIIITTIVLSLILKIPYVKMLTNPSSFFIKNRIK